MSWITILLMGLITYLTRSVIFLFNFEISERFKRFLSFVPYSILSAIIFFNLLITENRLIHLHESDKLIVGIILICIAVLIKKPLIVIPAGILMMVCFRIFF